MVDFWSVKLAQNQCQNDLKKLWKKVGKGRHKKTLKKPGAATPWKSEQPAQGGSPNNKGETSERKTHPSHKPKERENTLQENLEKEREFGIWAMEMIWESIFDNNMDCEQSDEERSDAVGPHWVYIAFGVRCHAIRPWWQCGEGHLGCSTLMKNVPCLAHWNYISLSKSWGAHFRTLHGTATFACGREKVWSKVRWLLDQVNPYQQH